MNSIPYNELNRTHKILVVDDESEIRKIYSEVLIRSGYQVHTAENGDVAFNVLHAARNDPNQYDLLITDNKMPRLSGVQLVEKFRSAGMTLPVILASSAPPADTDGLQLAAILQKPFFPEHLVQIVAQVLHADHMPASIV